jgi:hypothetical protein
MDPEILFVLSDAMKNKFTQIIKDLISISRSSHSYSYLTHKNSLPREVAEVNFYNLVNKDGLSAH